MTTDAPPEKMTNAVLALVLVQATKAYSASWSPEWIATLSEAARRLSAPAPAAPRVGDVSVDTVAEMICSDGHCDSSIWAELDEHRKDDFRHTATQIITLLSAKANAERDRVPREPTKAMQKVGYELVCELVETGSLASPADIWRAMYDTALSAPPAASAERDDDIALIQLIFANSKVTRATGERIVRAIFAAGYRKLAPAQSVGQSAAQGVVDGAHPLDEVIDRLGNGIGMNHTEAFVLGCKHSIEIARRVRQEHLNLIARKRLSALPKGQEHG